MCKKYLIVKIMSYLKILNNNLQYTFQLKNILKKGNFKVIKLCAKNV